MLVARIQERLAALGLSEAEACRRAGVAHTYIRDLREKKKTSPRHDTLARLAAALETTSEYLMDGVSTSSPTDAEVVRLWAVIKARHKDGVALDVLRALAGQGDKDAAG